VLRNQVGVFADLSVEWVHGMAPTAILYDANKNEVAQLIVGDKDLNELLALLKEHNFSPSRKKTDLGEPVRTATFGGHYYEFFAPATFFEGASSWASSRKHNNEPGYLLTITSSTEGNFISALMKENNIQTAWLGAQDIHSEGQWKWTQGPEKDVVFWETSLGLSPGGSYLNWYSGEPNDSNDEDCAVVMAAGHWNDARCVSEMYSVIVEFGSKPVHLSEEDIKKYDTPPAPPPPQQPQEPVINQQGGHPDL